MYAYFDNIYTHVRAYHPCVYVTPSFHLNSLTSSANIEVSIYHFSGPRVLEIYPFEKDDKGMTT
jgi:hypothetical protein